MSEWKETTLGEVCEFQEGYVNPSQNEHSYFGEDIKWLRANDLNDSYVYETTRKLSKKGFESAGKAAKLFKPNTIAISKSGSIGKLGYLKDYMCGNRAVINIEPKTTIDVKFLFSLLKANQAYFPDLAVGSVQPNLYVSSLATLGFYLPPLPEQNAIASVLSSLDDKIDLLHRQNCTLEKIAETLFRQWFVEEAIEGWKVDELKKYVTTVDNRGKTPPNEETQTAYPLIEANAINGDGRLINYAVIKKYVTEDIFNNWFRNKLSKYDTVITTVGANIGAMAMYVLEKGNIAQNIIGISANGISPFYLYQLLKYKGEEIFQMDIGGVQPSLKVPHILSLEIPIPSIELQNKFDNHILGIVSKMENNYNQINTLTQKRDILLPKLMSGEVRVEI